MNEARESVATVQGLNEIVQDQTNELVQVSGEIRFISESLKCSEYILDGLSPDVNAKIQGAGDILARLADRISSISEGLETELNVLNQMAKSFKEESHVEES